MKSSNTKEIKNTKRRINYQEKRSGRKYDLERKRRLLRWKESDIIHAVSPNEYLPTKNLPSPKEMNFIEYTDKLLEYLDVARYFLKHKRSINLDISKIESLSPDCIPILISHILHTPFNRKIPIFGNAPEDIKLKKLFTESGFYDFVRSKIKFKKSDQSLMHKESNFKVKTDVAERASLLAFGNGNYDEYQLESIYNIFIEMMSNTHHHASLENYGISKWWLYVFSNRETNVTSISFLDLGVGIFKSMIVKNYFLKLGKDIKLIKNINFVDQLLNGEIQSRIDVDNEIRGKGIPQILEYAKLDHFTKFYLITNDIKVDLKTKERFQLQNNFKGTFYHFELCSNLN